MESKEDLAAQLKLKQRELDLILAIDHIRDTIVEPPAMLAAIANVIADRFQANLCLLCLLNRETGDLELKAINDRVGRLGDVEPIIARELAQRGVDADDVTIWEGREVLPEHLVSALPDEIQIAAVPIALEGRKLGALMVARFHTPFGPDEVELLRIAESQIDSAVIQGYAYYDLQQRNKELETIYRVDRIRDLHLSFDEMLHRVLHELREVIRAEMGFVMLYNRGRDKLELRAATREDLFQVAERRSVLYRVANEALNRATMVWHNDLEGALRSILCIPLILNDEIIGVLGVVNRYGQQGFHADDRRLLNAIGSQMDTAIFESLERRRLRRVLGRSVDPRVMERLLANPDVDFLEGERSVLSVLYTDLRGSTQMAERTDPEILVEFINDYLRRMTEVILAHEGTLDKFIGDGVMALFGAPVPQEDHALRAVRVGLEMQAAHREVMEEWEARGFAAAPIGVGIATGELTVGEMGCPQRTDYTVIGQAANLGSRICGVARPGQVLISQETYRLVEEWVEAVPVPGLHLKGVEHPVTAYHIVRLK